MKHFATIPGIKVLSLCHDSEAWPSCCFLHNTIVSIKLNITSAVCRGPYFGALTASPLNLPFSSLLIWPLDQIWDCHKNASLIWSSSPGVNSNQAIMRVVGSMVCPVYHILALLITSTLDAGLEITFLSVNAIDGREGYGDRSVFPNETSGELFSQVNMTFIIGESSLTGAVNDLSIQVSVLCYPKWFTLDDGVGSMTHEPVKSVTCFTRWGIEDLWLPMRCSPFSLLVE